MSSTDEGRQAAEFCAELVRSHDFARYVSTLFVPADQRRALLAIYAFNVEISRVRELVSQPLPGEVRLQWWTDMLAGAGHGGVEGNPVAAELRLAIQNWRLPVERLSRLIEEHQFDLYNDPMPTMASLEGYINDTSSALFSLGAGIAGWQSPRSSISRAMPASRKALRRSWRRCRWMPRGVSCSFRCSCWRATAAAWRRCFRVKKPQSCGRRWIS